jgi:hypothetical protein
MGREQPSSQDELQMRAFWRRWHALMQGMRGPTDCSDRPEQRAAAEKARWRRTPRRSGRRDRAVPDR